MAGPPPGSALRRGSARFRCRGYGRRGALRYRRRTDSLPAPLTPRTPAAPRSGRLSRASRGAGCEVLHRGRQVLSPPRESQRAPSFRGSRRAAPARRGPEAHARAPGSCAATGSPRRDRGAASREALLVADVRADAALRVEAHLEALVAAAERDLEAQRRSSMSFSSAVSRRAATTPADRARREDRRRSESKRMAVRSNTGSYPCLYAR